MSLSEQYQQRIMVKSVADHKINIKQLNLFH
jgi:hypothetical protein